MEKFFDRLAERATKLNSLVCVGLDPVSEKIPDIIKSEPDPIAVFCREIIEATEDIAVAYKINLAFFEALGYTGWETMWKVREEIPSDALVIADAKRSDIGNTAAAYAKGIFEQMEFDAVTLNPLMGRDSVEPFLSHSERGCFILCLTSNPGAADFELPNNLFERIAATVVEWNWIYGNAGLVVGATYPENVELIREIAGDLWFLVPGVGAQGGDLKKVLEKGLREDKLGLIINSSRGIIYASSESDFAGAAYKAAEDLKNKINSEIEEIGNANG